MHTPGPWTSDATFIGSNSMDRFFITCHTADLPGGREEAEANARLIAAAPDLLAALVAVLPYINAPIGYAEQARAAIAKATKEI